MNINVGHLDTSIYHHYTREPGFPLWTMGICVMGEMVVKQGKITRQISAGTINVVEPNTSYVVYSAPGVRRHVEYFAILMMPADWERWFKRWPSDAPQSWSVRAPVDQMREAVSAFDTAFRASQSRRPMAQQIIANAIERVLILGCEFAPAADAKQRDVRVERAIDFAAEHLADRLSVDVLADVAGVSASRFAHLFADLHGESPMRFVEDLRMKRAQTLLLTSEQPIKLVARAVGFQSQFHFADRFRVCVGQSPSEYRRSPASAGVVRGTVEPIMDVRRD